MVSDVRGVLSLVDTIEDKDSGTVTLKMENALDHDADGRADLQSRCGQHDAAFVQTVVVVIGGALDEVHKRKKVAHLDVNPSNILLKGSEPQVSDWGASELLDRYGTCKAPWVYTKAYASPEVRANQRCGAAADVWSFGMTIVVLLTGGFDPSVGGQTELEEELLRLARQMVVDEPAERMSLSEVVSRATRLRPAGQAVKADS
jgi:serine/threonine protein kinase